MSNRRCRHRRAAFPAGLCSGAVLWIAVAVGLYPLVKTGMRELFRERKIGAAIFITLATLIAVLGGEAIAGSVLMIIILIAEFIAELNTDRARASIKGLIESVPQTATVRTDNQERAVPISISESMTSCSSGLGKSFRSMA